MRGYTFVLSVVIALIFVISSVEGKVGSGCKNGKCWAYCSPFSDIKDWCYTSGGTNKDSKGYAKCVGTSATSFEEKTYGQWQCRPNWGCNGPCSL